VHLSSLLHHGTLPEPRDQVDWFSKLPEDLGMMGNDVAGCCGAAGLAHAIQCWTSQNGIAVTFTTDQVIEIYKILTKKANGVAYDPNDPSTDTGLVLLDLLNYWRNEGFFGHKIGAFAKVNHKDIRECRLTVELFGCAFTGVSLPQVSLDNVGSLWDDTSGLIAGGHCMTAGKSDIADGLTFATWGRRQPATWPWTMTSVDEAYALFSQEWVDGSRPAPNGLDISKLRAYLVAL
jgi:hypothetical protein